MLLLACGIKRLSAFFPPSSYQLPFALLCVEKEPCWEFLASAGNLSTVADTRLS